MEQQELQSHGQWLHGRLNGAAEPKLLPQFQLLLWETGQLGAGALCKALGPWSWRPTPGSANT